MSRHAMLADDIETGPKVRRDPSEPNRNDHFLLGLLVVIAILCGTRLLRGWDGDFDQWFAAVVLAVVIVLGLRELVRR